MKFEFRLRPASKEWNGAPVHIELELPGKSEARTYAIGLSFQQGTEVRMNQKDSRFAFYFGPFN